MTALFVSIRCRCSGVEGTGDGGIFCAFEDGAAVGEDGPFRRAGCGKRSRNSLWRTSETVGERRFLSMVRSRARLRLVNLDGIAATHGDVGLGFALQVGEFRGGRRRGSPGCARCGTDWKRPVQTSQER